ncbi:MAG TPA: nucleotide pyrophosphohydrolase [Rugosibacter sp.]|nr:nucleotide pyrophosphohydrolase [Rugosibacter sp.]HQN46114.1 nucleotide pyrophosphohydrolase [Rugosibacter sp.]HQQ34390.1 nucleotide pyrophosphohydrolase [Rugosibacter sp.]
MKDLTALRDALRAFAAERHWQAFHTPKNLSMALIKEAAEIVEHFQWQTAEESLALTPGQQAAVGEEIADVLMYLVQLADALNIDPLAAAREKIIKNGQKYPVPDKH